MSKEHFGCRIFVHCAHLDGDRSNVPQVARRAPAELKSFYCASRVEIPGIVSSRSHDAHCGGIVLTAAIVPRASRPLGAMQSRSSTDGLGDPATVLERFVPVERTAPEAR